MSRPILYGADGGVVVEEMTEQDRIMTLLVEIFGTLFKYGPEHGPAPKPLTASEALPIIVDIVGQEAIEKRWTGLQLQVKRRPHQTGRES